MSAHLCTEPHGHGPAWWVTEDEYARLQAIEDAAREAMQTLTAADESSRHPWLAVMRARDELREALRGGDGSL